MNETLIKVLNPAEQQYLGGQMSPSPNFLQQQPQPQPNNFLLQTQQTGFRPLQPQQTGYAPMQQPQQTGFMNHLQPQPTGFSSDYNSPGARYSPAPPMPTIKFNPMPPSSSAAPPAASAAPQYQPGSIFSKMKDGTFANPSAPQDPSKLAPLPTSCCAILRLLLPLSRQVRRPTSSAHGNAFVPFFVLGIDRPI